MTPKTLNPEKALKALLVAVKKNDEKGVKDLLPLINLKDHPQPLILAAEKGHLSLVKLFAPKSLVSAKSNAALRFASAGGHLDVLKYLVPRSEKKKDSCLCLAAQNGHLDVVKFLLDHRDPKEDDSAALMWAALKGHKDIVELLIPVSDPKEKSSLALQWSVKGGHLDIFKILVPFSDIKAALKDIEENKKISKEKMMFFQSFSQAVTLYGKIEKQLEEKPVLSSRRKI